MKWWQIRLVCKGCGKTTFRPTLSEQGCAWCGGTLS